MPDKWRMVVGGMLFPSLPVLANFTIFLRLSTDRQTVAGASIYFEIR
jgi:hypothetical protein